ncbi:MAG: putative transport system permease protein [Acidobacteriota bacterium]|jgi:putative ABC transport system permease protein|nr:putative transport system permease protein [Acidobacteriota bacterium]
MAVDLATKSLLHDKLRFFITVSGVAFAVTLVFVQVGLFLGLMSNASLTIDQIDADLWVTSHNTPNVDFAHTFPETYIKRVRSTPGVAKADNLIVWFMNVNLPTGAVEGTEVYALENFEAWNFPQNVVEGNVADLRRGPYMVLDDSAKKRWGSFEIDEYREVLGRRLKIIGRTVDAKSFTTTPLTFMDYRLAQSLNESDLRGNTTYVLVKLVPGADVEAVRKELQARLPYNDIFTKDEWARRSRTYWIESTGLGLNMYITVFLGCLVGIVVVAQTLYTSTMEHIREFGTVKAIGGGNGDIYLILGKQATIAAIAGFALGALQAFALKPVMAKIDLKLIIPTQLYVFVLIGAVALCLGAALISFRKVASIDPALVFRT